MTKREARRLALLVACDELTRSLDVSDEWFRHPETDAVFTKGEAKLVMQEAKAIVEAMEKRIAK